MGQKNCCAEGEHKFNKEHMPNRKKDKNSTYDPSTQLESLMSSIALKTKNSLPPYEYKTKQNFSEGIYKKNAV